MEAKTPPKKLEPVRLIRAEGNDPTDLADQVANRVGARSVPSFSAASRVEKLKDMGAPESAKTAWEREQALSRGSHPKSGDSMRMIKVRSNAYRGKTDLIDTVVLHFNDEGVAVTPEGNRDVLERYATRRPGRISIEDAAPLVPSQDELLAAAKAAMAAQVVEEPAPVQEPAEEPEVVADVKEPVSVGREAVRTETPAPKKASKKK